MGQKTNPIGNRLGIIRGWESNWYGGSNYGDKLAEDYKLRKYVEQLDDGTNEDEEVGDDFESMYKGEISKSGAPILPSKRARKAPEKIQVSKEDLAELSETAQPDVQAPSTEENLSEEDISLDQVSEAEDQASETSTEETDPK